MNETASETEGGLEGCPVCGATPCYLICPNVDPYAGDPLREHEDYEFGAYYDHKLMMFGDQRPEAEPFGWEEEEEAPDTERYVREHGLDVEVTKG